MVNAIDIFSGFSVNDIDAARDFYRDALGLDVSEGPMGNLDIALPSGGHVFVYPKPDHTPASFTILNLAVDDIDAAVDDSLPTDEKGIARGRAVDRGPDIAWFRDPAGNVMSVLAG